MTLKEQLFNLDTVSSLTKSIKISFSEFNEEAFIEELTKTKVGIISTSPEREDTIIRK